MNGGKQAGPGAPLSLDELREAWSQFRAGQPVLCPYDGAPLALAVDGAANLYRFVCTGCVTASPWFESERPGSIKVHRLSDTGPTHGAGND
ncbi:MAG TPA: hypothetical protein VKU41_18360 [Polyangiaceae bacterium]|nr:hypothetical protein [Polyangiaceae bacterium]